MPEPVQAVYAGASFSCGSVCSNASQRWRKDDAESGGRSIDAISGGENSLGNAIQLDGGSFLAFWVIVSNRCEYLWQFSWRTGDNEQDKVGTRRRGRRPDEDDRGSPNKRISLQVKNQGCSPEQEGGKDRCSERRYPSPS